MIPGLQYGDFDACFDLIADDITWTNIGSTNLPGTYRGKTELMDKLLGEDDYVVALTSGTAETTDGRSYNNRYCQVIRIRDGKFLEVTEYFDTELAGSIFGSRAE